MPTGNQHLIRVPPLMWRERGTKPSGEEHNFGSLSAFFPLPSSSSNLCCTRFDSGVFVGVFQTSKTLDEHSPNFFFFMSFAVNWDVTMTNSRSFVSTRRMKRG